MQLVQNVNTIELKNTDLYCHCKMHILLLYLSDNVFSVVQKTYEAAMSQAQPGMGMAPKPGTPKRHIRNQPPTMLQVQY